MGTVEEAIALMVALDWLRSGKVIGWFSRRNCSGLYTSGLFHQITTSRGLVRMLGTRPRKKECFVYYIFLRWRKPCTRQNHFGGLRIYTKFVLLFLLGKKKSYFFGGLEIVRSFLKATSCFLRVGVDVLLTVSD